MPGPAPKDPSTRSRRNKAATSATLRADSTLVAPELPEGNWHPMVTQWWADLWASPMAPEYDDSDRHGLFELAMLRNDFWLAESPSERKSAAAEIRLQDQRFGLSPIDRRRLQWEIERSEQAQEAGQKRRSRSTPPAKPASDPRSILRAV